jgi:hypothetical protein
LPQFDGRGYSHSVDEQADKVRALRERVKADLPRLAKAVDNARLRSEAVILDAIATLDRCRAAQERREIHSGPRGPQAVNGEKDTQRALTDRAPRP